MTWQTISRGIALMGAVALLGAGCLNRGSETPNSSQGTGESVLQREAKMGDQYVIRHNVLSRGTVVPARTRVTINEIAPKSKATIQFSTALESAPEKAIASGEVKNIMLQTTHDFVLPTAWEGKTVDVVRERGSFWLTRDEWQELVRSGQTTMKPRVEAEAVKKLLAGSTDVQRTWSDFEKAMSQALTKQDLSLAKEVADAPKTMKVKISGQDKEVPVRPLKNGYGTWTVLNDASNPLFLGFQFAPTVAGFDANGPNAKTLAGLLSYSVTEFTPAN